MSGFNSGVHRYDFDTGAFLGLVGNVLNPLGMVHGPDGHLYVTEEATNKVLRFDGTTLAFLDEFVFDDPGTPEDENGPLRAPTGVLFGEDGHLYVASFNNDRILRFDGSSGAFLDTFVTGGLGNLNGPDAGMTFGPDGHLYVPSFFNHRVLKYDGSSGAFLGPFVPNGLGGLRNPRTVVFRSDGTALVTSEGSSQVLHYDAQGLFLGQFVNPEYDGVTGLAISPLDGNLYAASLGENSVRRFNGTSGNWEGLVVPMGGGGLDAPVFLAFHLDPYLRLGRISPGTTNAVNRVEVSGAAPGAVEVWLIGTSLGALQHPLCPHLSFGVDAPELRFERATDDGTSFLSGFVGDRVLGVTIGLQVFEPSTCRLSNLVLQAFEPG